MRCLSNSSFRLLIDLVNLCLNDAHFEHGVDRSDVEEEAVRVDVCLTCVNVHVADVGPTGREITEDVGPAEIAADVGSTGREITEDVGPAEIAADVGSTGREITEDVGPAEILLCA